MKFKYRSEIDGLRALAVFPVVFYHADFDLFSGGFVGVDIFFVISGYLITSLILRELENNTFSLVNFYERRARRILPALFLVIFVSSLFSFIFLTRSEIGSYFKSVIATLLFYSNFHFWKTAPYFQSGSDLEPLLHTWSLSIEEQFYIIFPLLLILLHKYFKKNILFFLIICFVSSLFVCQFAAVKTGGTFNFYFTLSRAWELALGGISAYYLFKKKNLSSNNISNNLLTSIGLSLILFSIFFFNKQTLYPSFYTLLPAIGTVLIILFARENSYLKKILSNKILVFIGLISYSFYLWHQPLLAFGNMYFENFSEQLKVFSIIIALFCSFLSWNFIEKLFRDKKKISFKKLFISTINFIIFFILFSWILINTFKPSSIYGSESNIAKKLIKEESVYLPYLETRNFSKFMIIHTESNPKNLIVGSSRIAFIGNKMLGDESLNLSVNSATIEDQIVLTMMAIEKFQIERIILAADPWIFNEFGFKPHSNRWKMLEKEYYKSINIIDSKSENETKILDFNENQSKKIFFLKDLINLSYDKVNLRQKKLLPKNFQTNKTIIFKDGTQKYAKNLTSIEGLDVRFIDPYLTSQKKIKLYNKFINYLLIYNKEIVLILPPYYEKSYKLSIEKNNLLVEIENVYTNFAKDKNLKIIGSYNPMKANCKKNEFYDDEHATEECIDRIIKTLTKIKN